MGASDRDYLRDRDDLRERAGPGDAWRRDAARVRSSTPLWARIVLALLAASFLATAVVAGF